MKLADNIHILDLGESARGLNLIVAWDESDLILIDTGFPGQLSLIEAAFEKLGLNVSKLTKIIITHQDIDHIGTLKELKAKSNAKVYAHEIEAQYIDGTKTPSKIAEREARFDSLTEQEKGFLATMKEKMPSLVTPIDVALKDNDKIDAVGGIKAIYTPGHTPGHAVYHFLKDDILVVGDAANIENRELIGPNPVHTPDMKTATESLEKIKNVNAKTIVCYHTGVLTK